MAPNAPSPAFDRDDPTDAVLQFPDNRLLIDLCGELDRNLAQIEARLGLTITRRGNMLQLHGEAHARAEATRVLNGLYARLEQGRAVAPGDVDAAIRLAPAPARPPGPEAQPGQLDMFSAEPLEIRTRKKVVEPRTPAQKDYVRQLFRHELVFGLGPAGRARLAVAVGAADAIDHRAFIVIVERIAEGRLDGARVDVAVFTNLTCTTRYEQAGFRVARARAVIVAQR